MASPFGKSFERRVHVGISLPCRGALRPICTMRALPHTHGCFVCGESNPSGLRLRFETDGRIVQARFTPRAEHVGFRGVVHGGLVSTLLDEIMVWACAVQTKRFAFCGELNVRFQQPVRPGEELLAIGELVSNRRDRLFEAKAELRNQNALVLASATGKYLPVQAADVKEMVTDFVGDSTWIFGTT
jgi:uncharacterized protein (TIGR00369 family)